MSEDYIAHFGVKGMKWGIRKKRETSGRKRSKKQNNDSRVQRILRSRKTKIAVGAAAVVGASFAGYFAYKKVGAIRATNARNAQLTNDFLKQVANISIPKVETIPIQRTSIPRVQVERTPIFNQSAKGFSQLVNSSYDQTGLDNMLNDLNAEMFGNIRNMMR